MQPPKRRPARVPARLGPHMDRSAPDPKLGRSATVKAAGLDQREQLTAVVLRVDDPDDLWLGGQPSRDAPQPTEPGCRQNPLEQVLLVVTLVQCDLASVRLAAVVLADPQRRLAFDEPCEEAAIRLADGHREVHGKQATAAAGRKVPANAAFQGSIMLISAHHERST